jgi:pimeloyl-ACP methyl ester carboxylesterase
MLTNPAAYGGDPGDAFDVVVPSLPGYGFSDKPEKAGTLFRIADLWATLMTQRLGYERFGAHGGDWGSTVTEHLARSYSDSLVGIHLTDVPFAHLFEKPNDLSNGEKTFIAESEKWRQKEGAYALIQSTVPQSLASFPRDLLPPPREWAERFFNVQRWTEMPRGGHFAAMEEPELLAEDIRAFFRPLRRAPKA